MTLRRWMLSACAATVLTVAVLWTWFHQTISQPLDLPANWLLEVKRGDTPQHVLRTLLSNGNAPPAPLVAKIWLRLFLPKRPIQVGVYEVTPKMNLAAVFETLQLGKQKQFSVTLIEGQTWNQWLNQMRNLPFVIDDWSPELSTRLLSKSAPDGSHSPTNWEGLLLAETYAYTAHTAVSELVERALIAMQAVSKDTLASYTLPISLNSFYEALILASIVEKETAQPDERPVIAGVFLNRLDKNMRLQTDPTVIYGLGEQFDGDITRAHLRQKTPYNTYVIKGLPPTPIAMVGRSAIESVFLAAPTDYLYFVAKGDGTHQFSRNLDDHNRAVQRYQLGK